MFEYFDVRRQQEVNFTGNMDSLLTNILARSDVLKLKVSYKQSFSLLKALTDVLEWCGLL